MIQKDDKGEVGAVTIVLFIICAALVILKWMIMLAFVVAIVILLMLAIAFFFPRWPKQTVICTLLLISVGIVGYASYQFYLTAEGNNAEVRIYLNEDDYTYTYYDSNYNKYFEDTIEGDTFIAIFEKYNDRHKCWDTRIESGSHTCQRAESIETFLNNMSLSEYYVSMTYKEYKENYDADFGVWLENETELVSKLEAEAGN